MKKIIKIWDIFLIALLGLFAHSCGRHLLKLPPAEYGPPPDYNFSPDTSFNPYIVEPEYGIRYQPDDLIINKEDSLKKK